jgi:hypothetical protein
MLNNLKRLFYCNIFPAIGKTINEKKLYYFEILTEMCKINAKDTDVRSPILMFQFRHS